MDKADLGKYGDPDEDRDLPRGPIRRLEIDDANRDHMAEHGVTGTMVVEAWQNGYVLVRNAGRHPDQP
jgi:hypothetical protein